MGDMKMGILDATPLRFLPMRGAQFAQEENLPNTKCVTLPKHIIDSYRPIDLKLCRNAQLYM